MEKLIQLEANDWVNFQEHLKKLHSDEFYQAPAQQWLGMGRSNVLVQTKTYEGFTSSTLTTPLKSIKSPPIKQLFC